MPIAYILKRYSGVIMEVQTYFRLFVTLCAVVFTSFPANAVEYEAHNNIIDTAVALIEKNLLANTDKEIAISQLDSRLRLKKCSKPLDAFFPPGMKLSGRTTVGVRCPDVKPWKLFVTATITIYSDVIVAGEHIMRGSTIQASDIRTAKKEVTAISRGYFTEPNQVIGKVSKFSINKDGIIYPSVISKPKLVKRGKEVIILARSGEIIIKTRGTAISDGTLGELIKVKNKHSHRIVQAKVIEANLVQVEM